MTPDPSTSSRAADEPEIQPTAGAVPGELAPPPSPAAVDPEHGGIGGFLTTVRNLPPLVKRIFIGVAFSSLGSGLTMPFLYVYLTRARGFETETVGYLMAWMGVLGFVLAPVGGSLIDRLGPRPVIVWGLTVEMAGVVSLAFIETWQQALVVSFFIVLGTAGLYPAITALMTRLVPEEQRETVYGLQFMLLNAGLGVGGLVSSLLIHETTVENFQRLYFINAGMYLVYVVVVLTLPRGVGGRLRGEHAHERLEGSWGDVLRDRRVVIVSLVAMLVLTFGYAQFETGFAAYSTDVAGIPPRALGIAFAANTGAIVLGQLFALRLIQGRRRSRMLALASLTWSAAWATVALSDAVDGVWSIAAITLGLAIFGLGETLWAPLSPAIVNALAPEHLRGRYNALQGMSWTVPMIIGPALAGTLLGHGLPYVWVAMTVGGTVLGAVCLLALKRVLTDEQDGLGGSR